MSLEVKKNTIQMVGSYLPLITGYFVILGSVRLMVYYTFFDLTHLRLPNLVGDFDVFF